MGIILVETNQNILCHWRINMYRIHDELGVSMIYGCYIFLNNFYDYILNLL